MIRLFLIITVLASGSAFAQMDQLYKRDGASSTVFGTTSPNSIEEYLDSRRNTGTVLNNPESGTSQHHFNGPSGMMRDSGTIFNTPMDNAPVGNTPMGMPQSAPDIMAPVQPFGPALVPTPWGR